MKETICAIQENETFEYTLEEEFVPSIPENPSEKVNQPLWV